MLFSYETAKERVLLPFFIRVRDFEQNIAGCGFSRDHALLIHQGCSGLFKGYAVTSSIGPPCLGCASSLNRAPSLLKHHGSPTLLPICNTAHLCHQHVSPSSRNRSQVASNDQSIHPINHHPTDIRTKFQQHRRATATTGPSRRHRVFRSTSDAPKNQRGRLPPHPQLLPRLPKLPPRAGFPRGPVPKGAIEAAVLRASQTQQLRDRDCVG